MPDVRDPVTATVPSPPRRASPGRRVVALVCVIAPAVALGAHAWLGTTSRYVWDDYCFASAFQSRGFFGSLEWWYGRWSGRMGHIAALNTAELAGEPGAQWMPAINIVVLVVALAWAIRGLAGPRARRPGILASFALAEVITVATLLAVPDVFQSLYWRVGVLEYIPPFAIMALVASAIARVAHGAMRSGPVLLGAVGLASLLAGTFSETQVAVQGALAAPLAFAALRSPALRAARAPIVAVFAGTAVAALVVILAPGNDVRRTFYPTPPEALPLARQSFGYALRLLAETVTRAPAAYAGTFAVSCLVAFGWARPGELGGVRLRRLALVPPAVLAVAFAGVLPSVQGQSAYPVARALVTPVFALVCILAVAGFVAGTAAGRMRSLRAGTVAAADLAVLAVALSIAATTHALEPRDVARSYAAHADRRNEQVRALAASGASAAVVAIIPAAERAWVGGLEIVPDPTWPANVCMAEYYGLAWVIAR